MANRCWQWLVSRHADPERENADREIAKRQLDEARQVSAGIAETSAKLRWRQEENGFGESVYLSMQPRSRRPQLWKR